MTNKKKMTILIASLVLFAIASVVTMVVVLVASTQTVQSNVSVNYTATDVACDLYATYAMKGETTKTSMRVGGETDGATQISFNENSKEGTLSPTEEIILSQDQNFVVFEYRFVNTSTDIPMTVTLIKIPEVTTNIKVSYYITDSAVSATNYTSIQFSLDEIVNKSYLLMPNQNKYIYIKAEIKNMMQDAEFSGTASWNLVRSANAGTVATTNTTTTNNNSVLSLTGPYAGSIIEESSLSHSTTDVNVLGWYTDETCTQPATFPLQTTSETVLYGEYKESNLPLSNVSYDEATDSYTIDAEALDTTSASTLSARIGYTPIKSSDTVLVIPDRLTGPNGIKPVTKITNGTYSTSLLNGNTTIQKIYLGNNITTIGDYFAQDCTALKYINIPQSVTSLGNYAFCGCSGLISIIIPDKVTSIGNNAFDNCSGLTSITIGNSVTSIGDYAFGSFYGCTSLTSITIPASVKYIGVKAFAVCANLANVTFSDTANWYCFMEWGNIKEYLSATDLSNTTTAATYLKDTYNNYEWYKE